jgi:4-aminobutyrate aminotransferase-like enzyme
VKPVPASTPHILDLLRTYESRNVTFMAADGSWPIVWDRARGAHVWDAEGKRYLDLTAAFGVAAAGHGNPRVVQAGQRQMSRLLHAMGDVHPHALKARLACELSRLTFERWTADAPAAARLAGKTVFGNSGFEAVEAALKTALLATGKPGIIAFQGAYHGLGYGALNVTHRARFRTPFQAQLRQFGHFVDFPTATASLVATVKAIDRLFQKHPIGAVLVEPVQGRGGIRVPPLEFLLTLRQQCDRHGALLILDEVYTGFGRTGRWFACEHSQTVPDLVCLGKALTGGFPLSACVGRSGLMDAAWPASDGEAIHTSTFLGHPVGCAMALAQIRELEQRQLVARSERLGGFLLDQLQILARRSPCPGTARGLGLMAGLELRETDGQPATRRVLKLITQMLHRGCILLPDGEASNVIAFTPPLTITRGQLQEALDGLGALLAS